MDELLYFYSSSAQISFVLLGFWWAILTFKWGDWMHDALRRRLAYYVSLHFLLPGIMSLVSIVNLKKTAFWRLGFGIGGLCGVAAALMTVQAIRSADSPVAARASAWYAMAVLNLAVAIVAAFAPTMGDLFNLKGIELEAILTALLLFLGVQLAWWLFVEQRRDDAPGGPASELA